MKLAAFSQKSRYVASPQAFELGLLARNRTGGQKTGFETLFHHHALNFDSWSIVLPTEAIKLEKWPPELKTTNF